MFSKASQFIRTVIFFFLFIWRKERKKMLMLWKWSYRSLSNIIHQFQKLYTWKVNLFLLNSRPKYWFLYPIELLFLYQTILHNLIQHEPIIMLCFSLIIKNEMRYRQAYSKPDWHVQDLKFTFIIQTKSRVGNKK